MLEDRLRDQVRQFSVQGEDPSKIDLLRRAALAHSLSAPVTIDQLMRHIDFHSDPQYALRSLSDEYLTLDRSLLSGLHWVRSDHLVRILHEGYPNMASTALAVLNAIPLTHLSTFVSNALCRDELDGDFFLDGLVEKAKSAEVGFFLTVLDGVFDAGERHFFETNKTLFDEAYEEFGPAGPFLMNTYFMPTVKLKVIDEIAEMMGERGDNLRKLSELSSRFDMSQRGLEQCAEFLRRVTPSIRLGALRSDLGRVGRLLDWCAMCEVDLPAWADVKDELTSRATILELSLEQFCDFTQGLFRYDEVTYMSWFSANREDAIGYLKLHTDCARIDVEEKTVSIEFFLREGGGDMGHELAVSRLRRLRSALPFCDQYRSHGVWITAFGLIPTWDETNKNISKEHLPFASDAEKNATWGKTVQNRYIPDSYYRFEDAWYSLRSEALEFVRALSSAIGGTNAGRKRREPTALAGDAIRQLDHSLRFIPHLSGEAFLTIGKSISQPLQNLLRSNSAPNEWASSFQNFFVQIIQYIKSRDASAGKLDEQTGRLAVYNFNEARSKLEDMQVVFSQFFHEAPDYFGASELNENEKRAYSVLADLLDALITEPPSGLHVDIRQYVRQKRERKREVVIRRLRSAVTQLEGDGISFIFPRDIYIRHPARYLALAFSVSDIHQIGEPLSTAAKVVDALAEIVDAADFFCLVPIHNGARFLQGGYQFSSSRITEFVKGNLGGWETLVPHELPEGAMRCLPQLPLVPSTKLQLRAEVQIILAEIEALADWREEIEQLGFLGNRFERQLYNKYQERLLEAEQNLGVVTEEVRKRLLTDPPVDPTADGYKKLISILEAIGTAAQSGDLQKLSTSESFNMRGVVDVVESLIVP